MGSSRSKPQPPPLLSRPWRDIDWGDKLEALQYVRNYQPQAEDQEIRILLHGSHGSGKSSFINSVQSVLRGRMYIQALANSNHLDTFTKKYITYKIPNGPGTFYPFVFNDIMGLGPSGVLADDVKLALKGHVKEGYKFNPRSKLSEDDPSYKTVPTVNDKVHVLVCVVDASTISQIPDNTWTMIRDIRQQASDLGIPQVAILTKVDMACPAIQEDIKNVYKSKYLKKKMETFSATVGIPMNCIFPVKNYSEEINLNNSVDTLILSVLKNIISFGEDCLNFQI